MGQYILSIDQGTSATKAVLFDQRGRLVGRHATYHQQYYPEPGWVEHDAEEIYQRALEAIGGVLDASGIEQDKIVALAIANQRETAVVWDRRTGKPVHNAVVWQCQRGKSACEAYKEEGYEELVKNKTGLVLDPYFSATKVKWVLDHVAGARQEAEAGNLLFGTIDSWLVWKLTGGKVHVTDYSNACRTLLFNIHTLEWDAELAELFAIPRSMMAQVVPSDRVVGRTAIDQGFKREIPIAGVLGDSHASLFGHTCFERGMAKATYGTGSSMMTNTGPCPVASRRGLVTSFAWVLSDEVTYVLEGNVHCTGATIKWLVDDLGLIPDAKGAGEIATSVSDTQGVYFVPAFVGLGAPYWDSTARAAITGITRGTKRAHIVRAAEEAIAYQIKDVLDLMAREAQIELDELRVDGGGSRDDFLLQFQADILGIPVVRTSVKDLAAMGSAFAAGLATGFWRDKAEIEALRVPDATFTGRMDPDLRKKLYSGWKEAVRKVISH